MHRRPRRPHHPRRLRCTTTTITHCPAPCSDPAGRSPASARLGAARPVLFLFGCFGFYKKPRNFRTKPNTRTNLSGERRRRRIGCVARAPEERREDPDRVNSPRASGPPPAPYPHSLDDPRPCPPGCSGPDPGSGLPTATGNAVRVRDSPG